MPFPWLLAAGAAAVAAAALYASSGGAPAGGAAAAPGVLEVRPGVVIGERQRSFLAAWRAAVPAEIPIVITSGTRTVDAQARAMIGKYKAAWAAGVKAGGTPAAGLAAARKELLAVYGPIAEILLALPPNPQLWSAAIQQQISSGRWNVGPHLRGAGLDVSISALTPAHRQILVDTARALGAKPLVEAHPLHLHLGLP